MTAYSVYHLALIAQPDGCGDVHNTHHTQAHHPLSLFHTHFLSHTHTPTPCALYAYPDALFQYASCHCKLPWQHFASCLLSVVAFIFFLFLVLSPRSHVSDTSPLILILSGVMLCNISLLSCPSFFLQSRCRVGQNYKIKNCLPFSS